MSEPRLSEALRRLLRDIPERIPAERIDRIWLFAPREVNGRESGLVVLALHRADEARPGHRDLVTWRYEATVKRGNITRTDLMEEQGSAPADRIDRLIEGVLGRLGDAAETPIAEAVGGDPERWNSVLETLSPGGG